jgi:thiol-disulfide isomerase/thioredoxin
MRRIVLSLLAAGIAVCAFAQEELPARVRMDQTLPRLAGLDLAGNPVNLDGIVGKKTVVLSFWSIYCSDCVRELDDLRAIREEYPSEEVEVVAVNTDSGLPLDRIASFMRRYEGARGGPLNVFHLLDRDFALVNSLGVRYIPLMITLRKTGEVASILTGYKHEMDRERLGQALEQGRVALGAWSEGLRRRLRTVLRGAGPTGEPVEWGSFRVEEGMSLFGWYDGKGWLADASSRPNRDAEKSRVEKIVHGRLKMALMKDAMGSLGLMLPDTTETPFQARGVNIPVSPFDVHGRWVRLYNDMRFDDLYSVESETKQWFGDEMWGGLIADVDLGRMRSRLKELGIDADPERIRLRVVSDYDYKPRALLKALQETSYRVAGFRDEDILYHGSPEVLLGEINGLGLKGLSLFSEKTEEGTVRIEVY